MTIRPILIIVALLALAGCQGGLNSYQSYTGACTEQPYEAGFCELPTKRLGPAPVGYER